MLKDTAFCRLQENLAINIVMDTATKTGIDAAKTESKREVQKTAEATGDLLGNKIANKTTSIGKLREKEKNKQHRRNLHSTRKKENKSLMT